VVTTGPTARPEGPSLDAPSLDRAERLLAELPPSAAVWCSGLRKRYGRQTAVDGVSFTVERGEVVGLLGPNGAGKTSVIKILLGLVRPDAGEVLLLGRPARARRPGPAPATSPSSSGTNPGSPRPRC
jgi:ABC-2 type transport system ATP-binding protein